MSSSNILNCVLIYFLNILVIYCISRMLQGYVKNVSKKGCFIMLSRNIDARILISNLSDDFIENPEKDFSIGQLVTGK